jgi:hypothetical protein
MTEERTPDMDMPKEDESSQSGGQGDGGGMGAGDTKLDLLAVPVTDVDRAKAFHVDQVGSCGRRWPRGHGAPALVDPDGGRLLVAYCRDGYRSSDGPMVWSLTWAKAPAPALGEGRCRGVPINSGIRGQATS